MAPSNPSLLSEMPEFDAAAAPGATASMMGSANAELDVTEVGPINALPLAAAGRSPPLTVAAIDETTTLGEAFAFFASPGSSNIRFST